MARRRHALHPVCPCFPFRLLLISHSRIPHPSPQLLLAALLAFASSTKSDEFAHTSYPCAICLSERKGVYCLALSCGHVFCRTCLIDMWGLHVKEGQVSRVGCPEPKCGKADAADVDGLREATEDEVRAVLSESELDRWKWLRRKRDLERDPTMIHCPMEYCQEPVPKPKSDTSSIGDSDEDEFGWARLRTCTTCGYAFCAFCRRTW
jgi:E3 ubiquitin-protein ligase RNF14